MNIHITVDKEYNCVFGTWSFPLRDLNRTMDEIFKRRAEN